MGEEFQYSDHALRRMAQRGISEQEIHYVCQYGRCYHVAGSVYFFLGRKDIPDRDRNDPSVQRLEGTTVLVDRSNTAVVVTVYRNRQASRQIRRKSKHDFRKQGVH